ncbi:MAG: hypothetical protein OXG88_05385 [Gammaproteobacteria bacterium]|nr:hypothetical protein [Gammaproteobacteria bacterium]
MQDMNQVEEESVILNTAWGMIDGMVNWMMFCDPDQSSVLQFQSPKHEELFVILLTDFLSQPIHTLTKAPKEASGSDLTFIFQLRRVCQNPQLGSNPASLHNKLEEFAGWLETCKTYTDVNLPEINVIADIEVDRQKYIKMCGNIAKHNPLRLRDVVKNLRKLIKKAGHDIKIQDTYSVLESFYNRFFRIFINCHSYQIIGFLDDIRSHIFEYLGQEYDRSRYARNECPAGYGYKVPESIRDPLASGMYWDLMERVRTKPYGRSFDIDEDLKRPHHTESST